MIVTESGKPYGIFGPERLLSERETRTQLLRESLTRGIIPKQAEGAIIMPNVEMVKATRGLRGKGNEGKKVEFDAISETSPRPDNPLDAALQLVKGDLQDFWDRFVLGFNEYSYNAVADPIAAFLDPTWDADKTKNFRMTCNAMAKLTGRDKEEVAAELLKAIS